MDGKDWSGDWGPGGEHRSLIPTPSTEGNYLTEAEIDRRWPVDDAWGSGQQVAAMDDDTDVLATFADHQVEVWDIVCQQVLAGHPDVDAFSDRFEELPASIRAKAVAFVVANPHVRGARLIDGIRRTLNLSETTIADRWSQGLSEEDIAILAGGG